MRKYDSNITRRDFVKGTLIGSGAMLLTMPPPIMAASDKGAANGWDGYAGVGDYARSNGNTKSTMTAAHLIRDNKIDELLSDAIDTGESYDLVVIGGGFAGLSAARAFLKGAKPGQTCLILENHALAGGEAKRNEFIVNGYKITGPQGSNLTVVPTTKGDWYDELWDDLAIPRNPTFQKLTGYDGKLRIAKANYLPMFGIAEQTATCGYFFDKETFGGETYWDIDSSENGYTNTAFPEVVKADLKRLKEGEGVNLAGDEWEKWLDSITYKDYFEKVLKIQLETTQLFDNVLSTTGGLGCDAVSALHAMKSGLPGFDKGFGEGALYRLDANDRDPEGIFSFPGGNDGVFRLLLKSVLPGSIAGGESFEEIHDALFQFQNFDRPQSPVRIRLNATAIRVEHDDPDKSNGVTVTYQRNGKIYQVKARGVVSAVGGWVNRHIVKDLPEEYIQAYDQFVHGSNMIINVALTNWRFLARLGISGCHYFSAGGLGTFCNIRQPVIFGENQAPLNPDKPIVLTFYMGFPKPGLTAKDQAANARWELLSKSYKDIETALRQHMTHMFSSAGFDDKRDIAGIVLNRWGHAYLVSTPGFIYGKADNPAPLDVITKRFGRIAFGHSEHNGLQEWFGAVEHGERAAQQVLEIINT